MISEETRAKLRAAKLGKPRSPETREKIRAARLGTPHSAETREKISATLKGQPAAGRGAHLRNRKEANEAACDALARGAGLTDRQAAEFRELVLTHRYASAEALFVARRVGTKISCRVPACRRGA